uniref:Sperm acrosome associated 1 n=1 Tax=Dromaius novaehollandiae TaxID=8790 RepID=A0A8C4JIB2_DRONO
SGVCTVTCGIGIREVLLTNGCPGTEAKCIVRVEECRGQVDCGWGKPISDSPASVKMSCIFISPENRFKYVWKMLIPNQPAVILPNDSAIMEVHRDTHPVTFQCETQEKGSVIASVKYTVYTTPGKLTRMLAIDTVLIFSLVTGIIVIVAVMFALIFIILHRPFGSDQRFVDINSQKRMPREEYKNKTSLYDVLPMYSSSLHPFAYF